MLAGGRALVMFADGCSGRGTPAVPPYAASLDRLAEHGVTGALRAQQRAQVRFASCRDQRGPHACDDRSTLSVSADASGWLAMRRPNVLSADEWGGPGCALAQLLGVTSERLSAAGGDLSRLQGFEKGSQQRLSLSEQYGGLKIEILSNQPAVTGLCTSLQASCSLTDLSGCDSGEENNLRAPWFAQACTTLKGEVHGHLADGTTDLLIVHLDSRALAAPPAVGGNAREDICLSLLGAVAEDAWKNGEADLLQVVVMGGGLHDLNGLGRGEVASGLGSVGSGWDAGERPAWLRELRPPQSCDMHNGRL